MKKKKMKRTPQSRYKTGRWTVLSLVLMTLVNIIGLYLESDSYYLCSVSLSYFLWCREEIVSYVIAIAILVPYILAFIFSKNNGKWMIVALVLACVDTLVSGFVALAAAPAFIGDTIFHIVVIVILATAVKHRRIGTMTDEELKAASCEAARLANSVDGSTPYVEQYAPEVNATFTIKKPDKKMQQMYSSDSAIRFEENEMVLGGSSVMSIALVGSLGGEREIMRFRYDAVKNAEFSSTKKIRDVILTLSDGTLIRLSTGVVTESARKLNEQLNAHGIHVREPVDK